jgi:hypothetical protein
MSTINHNAIHEAGHVVGALCCELRVSSVFRTSSGKYTARCGLNPWRERPHVVYSMKIAGRVAVEISNEKRGRSDDDGFGKPDDPESDAYCVARLRLYLMSLTEEVDVVRYCAERETAVNNSLRHYWHLVEALASEIGKLKPSGQLTAARIGKIIQSHDPNLYNKIEKLLV